MPLEQDLNQLLKQAMYAKDQRTTDVVRMIKTKIMERRTAAGFKGEVDDALIEDVIAAYQKQLRKAHEEYEQTGERGAEMRAQLSYEIDFCNRFLPQKLGEPEVRKLVAEAIAALGATDVKQVGRVMGQVMKSHKALVEAEMVKKVAEELLAKK